MEGMLRDRLTFAAPTLAMVLGGDFLLFSCWYGWEPVPVQQRLGIPPWKVADLHEGRIDPCEEMV